MKTEKFFDSGFTGLEAAMVLIAFVVVAAVFSYVVLGAGFLTSQKSQESIHTGVQQTTSAVELSGPVSVRAAGTSSISNISFYLQLVAHGDGIDMSKVTYSVSTPKKIQTYTSSEVNYTWVKLNNGHTGTTAHSGILSSLEMVLIDINPGFSSTDMTVNDKFMVEVKPPQGPAIPISRTIPAGLATGVWYPVY